MIPDKPQMTQGGSHVWEKGLEVPNGDRQQEGSETGEVRSEEQQEEEEEEGKVLPGPRQGTHFSPCRWPFPRQLPPWRVHSGAGERREKEKTSERSSWFWTVTPWPACTAQLVQSGENTGSGRTFPPGKRRGNAVFKFVYIYIFLFTSTYIGN